MNEGEYERAVAVASILAQLPQDDLFEKLGVWRKGQTSEEAFPDHESLSYEAAVAGNTLEAINADELREVGRRWWCKIEQQLLGLVCDPSNTNLKQLTNGRTIPQVAAALATAGVVAAFAPPAWVIVATTIFASKVVETGIEATCEVWRENAQNPNAAAPPHSIG